MESIPGLLKRLQIQAQYNVQIRNDDDLCQGLSPLNFSMMKPPHATNPGMLTAVLADFAAGAAPFLTHSADGIRQEGKH